MAGAAVTHWRPTNTLRHMILRTTSDSPGDERHDLCSGPDPRIVRIGRERSSTAATRIFNRYSVFAGEESRASSAYPRTTRDHA